MSRTNPTTISIVLVAAAIALAACGSSGSSTGAADYGATTPTTAAAPATSKSPAAGQSGSFAVEVAHDAQLGDHLVDAQGRTLYLFEADHGLTTACTGSCVTAWPAATATKVSAGPGIDAAKVKTVTGEAPNQLAYAGHLLYRFSGDTAPGDANGVGIPQWYAVTPEGASIEMH